MKIKIKVKNIIFLVLSALFIYFFLVPFATLEAARYLDNKGSDKAKLFYESLISRPLVWKKSQTLYEYGRSFAGFDGKFQLMVAGWGGGSPSSMEDINKGLEAFERILKDKNIFKNEKKYRALAYESVLDTYINLQSPQDLLTWIDWGKKDGEKEIRYISDLYLGFYHLANRDYESLEKILNTYDETFEILDYKYYYLKGEEALFKGNLEEAQTLYKKGIESKSYSRDYKESLFASYSYERRDYWLEDYYKKIKGQIKIRGRVTFNGEPMPFVEVYLQETGQGYRSGGGYLVGITDINGVYETIGFEPDRYELGIGLDQVLLYDKVYQKPNIQYIDLEEEMEFDFTFVSPFKVIVPKEKILVDGKKFSMEWDKVEGADYYKVEITSFSDPFNKSGSYVSFGIEDENYNRKIKENKAVFDLEVLKEKIYGLSWSGDNMLVNPIGILSLIVPDNTYPLVVNAYDKDDNLISSSTSLRKYFEDLPSIEIKGQLSQGEKLIYDMKYEEAIDFYTELLEKDKNNTEALFYLSRIYMVSYEKDKYDYDKAMEYASSYDRLKGGNSLKYDLMSFMDHKSRRQYGEVISEIFKEIPLNARDDSYYYNLGRFNLSLGDYKLARDSFENLDYGHIYILYIDLYYGNMDKALDLVRSSDFNMYNMSKKLMEKALVGINDTENEDYEIIQDIIEKVLSEDIDESRGKKMAQYGRDKIKNTYIKLLLEEIIKDNHWDSVFK